MLLTCPLFKEHQIHSRIKDFALLSINHLILVPNQEEKDLILGALLIENIDIPSLRIVVLAKDTCYHYIAGQRKPYVLVEHQTRVARLGNGDVLISWEGSSRSKLLQDY